MSELHRRLKLSKLPPMGPNVAARGGAKRHKGPQRRDYTPVTWDNYFTNMRDVPVGKDTFRAYELGSAGPVCFFLHGGGFSALSWALLAKDLTTQVECRCVAVDMRGHGDTATEDEENLSAEQLASDVAAVISSMYGDELPPIIIIGHSMGGAIGVHTVFQDLVPTVIGLVVIDVVEGTALDALSSMQSFLLTRPQTFKSVEYAVEWCVRSGQVRNIESAKVSMVGQVKKIGTDETATHELDHRLQPPPDSNVIEEEDEDGPTSPSVQTATSQTSPSAAQSSTSSPESFKEPTKPHPYTWRINLSHTEKYWRGWFEGLSDKFLSCPVPKILVLAGVNRLDKDLTVGQMQGRFQMSVLPQSGHAVHEDSPDKVAEVLATFLVRNKFAEPLDDFNRVFPSC